MITTATVTVTTTATVTTTKIISRGNKPRAINRKECYD